jgi:hypothetical protein
MIAFGKIRERHKQFCFRDIHPYNRTFYWEKEECLYAILEASKLLKKQFTSEQLKRMTCHKKLIELNKINNKIPNIDIEWYYPNE